MNRSGWALRCLAERYQLEPAAVLVVYDEVALPLGRLRARARGGAGGHRGMESVLENLRTEEVGRLRLGIGPLEGGASPADLAGFVLAPFDVEEAAAADALVTRAVEATEAWLAEGIEAMMNRFNA
jgi:PTH1 family peptidyl-tRNA hydrolase